MKTPLLLLLTVFAFSTSISQITFTDNSELLVNQSLTSGVAMGVCDMNGDGLDDIIRLENASDLEIEYQNLDGSFSQYIFGNIGDFSEWAIAIADVDKNGFNDIVAGGLENDIKLLTANSIGTAYRSSLLPEPKIFLQNTNFADINNDGAIDIFGCSDLSVSSVYTNDGNGAMTYDLSSLNTISTVVSDNSGNYGSIWTDYDNDGDQDLYITKCRQGVTDPNDGRRINLLFQNDGNNNYVDVAEDANLIPFGQSWAANFEDIDNDGDLDCFVINHDILSVLYENNGDGTFTDITTAAEITAAVTALGFGIQVIMKDYDNDTFVDILLTGFDGNHILLMNDGDKTFTRFIDPFPTNALSIHSAAVGDLNNDGFLDVIAGFATGFNTPSTNPDKLFLNSGNSNNWSAIELKGIQSNSNGIGSRIELHGDWGMQIREVRSGESYGTMNTMISHFGIGSATSIDKIVIKWPSGVTEEIFNPVINQLISISEGQTLSIEKPTSSITNFIYKNPVTKILNITTETSAQKIKISISNLNGSVIKSETFKNQSAIFMDVQDLSEGMYFATVIIDDKTTTIKFIKK